MANPNINIAMVSLIFLLYMALKIKCAKVIKTIKNIFKIRFGRVKSLCIFARSFGKGFLCCFLTRIRFFKDTEQ